MTKEFNGRINYSLVAAGAEAGLRKARPGEKMMFPIPFLKGSETFNSNRCFFIKVANRRAIFLKLINNICHQMQAATLQMNMYTP